MDKETEELSMDSPNPLVDGPTLEEETPEPEAKGEKQEEAPPAPQSETVPVKALQDERRKRQELHDQLEALKASQQAQEPSPTIWEDDKKWQEQFGQTVTQNAAQYAAMNARLDTSEMLARQAHAEDFDQVKTEWLELAAQNPEMRQQALSDPHPWERAYQQVRNAKTMKELGASSIDDVIAKKRAEWEAEMAAKSPARSFPNSTVQDGSVSGRNGPDWAGPIADKDILPMG